MNISERKRVAAIGKRIRRLHDGKGVALSAIAMKSGVEQGTVKALYEQKEFSKRTIAESTAAKMEKGLDAQERALGMVKRCAKCGRELPYGQFHNDKCAKDGMRSACKECLKQAKKGPKKGSRQEREEKAVNNNTETAMTAEIVRRVREEDKRDVESKFMAPYFGITPKQLDEVRKGIWDKLLLTKKEPKRADTVLEAVEMLRGEVASLRREVEAVMLELGIEVKEVA